jgi:hypothetical protein
MSKFQMYVLRILSGNLASPPQTDFSITPWEDAPSITPRHTVRNPIPLRTERLGNAPNDLETHRTPVPCTQRVKSLTLHTEARRIHSLHISTCFPSRSPYYSFTSHIFTISPRAGHKASLSIIVVITPDSLSTPLVFVSFLSPLVYATALYVFKPACTFLVGCQNPSVLTRTTRSERYRLQSRVILEHLPLTSRDHHFSPSNS